MNNDMDILSNLARMTGVGSWPANFQNIAKKIKNSLQLCGDSILLNQQSPLVRC